MKRKILIICMGLLAAASTTQATSIQSISATTVDTMFVSAGGFGALSMADNSGINVEDVSGVQTTYSGGSFSLFTILTSDASGGGIAKGNFAGGAFSYKDSSSNPLLEGNISSFILEELPDGFGMLIGRGIFTVTGGSLQGDFHAIGKMMNISFSVPTTIIDFSTSFNHASSNMTVLSAPEPATMALLIPAILVLRKKRNSK
jgi:hypothetical protein